MMRMTIIKITEHSWSSLGTHLQNDTALTHPLSHFFSLYPSLSALRPAASSPHPTGEETSHAQLNPPPPYPHPQAGGWADPHLVLLPLSQPPQPGLTAVLGQEAASSALRRVYGPVAEKGEFSSHTLSSRVHGNLDQEALGFVFIIKSWLSSSTQNRFLAFRGAQVLFLS